MALVEYSDSDEDEPHAINTAHNEQKASPQNDSSLKRKRQASDHESTEHRPGPPPLPGTFQTLYATNVRASTTDDPALHGGRQRQVPHVVGNWPSFVYLEWLPSESDLICLDKIIRDANKQRQDEISDSLFEVRSSLRSELGVRLPLHISLSASLILTTDNKNQFEQTLIKAIQDARVRPFDVTPAKAEWVSNFDATRHFLILTFRPDRDSKLQELLNACNRVARDFNQPALYSDGRNGAVRVINKSSPEVETKNAEVAIDKFHISIAWSLQPPPKKVFGLEEMTPYELDYVSVPVREVYVKVGNHVTTVPLLKQHADVTRG